MKSILVTLKPQKPTFQQFYRLLDLVFSHFQLKIYLSEKIAEKSMFADFEIVKIVIFVAQKLPILILPKI